MRRDALSRWIAIACAAGLVLALSLTADRKVLMPGQLAAVHGSQADCQGCHTRAGVGKFAWLPAAVFPSDAKADSKACMTCHKISSHQFNPHNVDTKKLERRTETLRKVSEPGRATMVARLRSYLFSAQVSFPDGIYCATCHKEHQGQNAILAKVTDARCQSCHVIQFDDFQYGHPKFRDYPFRRRTRIQFDHAQHFGKNFSEAVSRKRLTDKAPAQCMDCHTSSKDRKHMAVKPFDQTCSACHLGQITGKARASGPKGLAVFTLPGIDVAALKARGLDVGTWPASSEAELSPLMALLIAIDDRRRKLLRTITKINLLDLSKASDAELKAAATFAWEVKALLNDLIVSKSSRIVERIKQAAGTDLERRSIIRLITALPRAVLIQSQQVWLPNLESELANRAKPEDLKLTPIAANAAPKKQQQTPTAAPKQPAAPATTQAVAGPPPPGQSTVGPPAPRGSTGGGRWEIDVFGKLIKGPQDRAEQRRRLQPESSNPPASTPAANPPANSTTPATASPGASDPSSNLKVDGESWAVFGGWYRGEFAIMYRPAGHRDDFLRTWLNITSRGASGDTAAGGIIKSAFQFLTAKDTPGQCTKCHSVDKSASGKFTVNWAPSSIASKTSRFTKFLHEPHFGVIGKKGCLTCHAMAKTKPTKSSYKDGNPATFVSNFQKVDKKTCATCHNKSAARQDCTLCHNYHVTKVKSPSLDTTVPKN